MIEVRRAIDTRGRVTSPKHDVERDVPISRQVSAALKRLERRGDYVITRKDGGALGYRVMYKNIVQLYSLAGVPKPSMPRHCLRHSYGSELARAGVPIAVIAKLMGHVSIVTTQRYLTVLAKEKSAAVQLAFGTPGQQAGNSQNN